MKSSISEFISQARLKITQRELRRQKMGLQTTEAETTYNEWCPREYSK